MSYHSQIKYELWITEQGHKGVDVAVADINLTAAEEKRWRILKKSHSVNSLNYGHEFQFLVVGLDL